MTPAPPIASVLELSRSAGNAAVARALLQRKPPSDLLAAEKAHAAAQVEQRAGSAVLKAWLTEGSTQKEDELLKNSCDWILTGKTMLYAVTATGDMAERLEANGQDPSSMRSYFPKAASSAEAGHIWSPGGAQYNWRDLNDNAGINFQGAGTTGWNSMQVQPNAIAVTRVPTTSDGWKSWGSSMWNWTDSPATKEDFFTTIKHEVQHAADRHMDTRVQIDADLSAVHGSGAAAARLLQALGKRTPMATADLDAVRRDLRPVFESLRDRQQNGETLTDLDLAPVNGFFADASKQVDLMPAQSAIEGYKSEYRAYSYQEDQYRDHTAPFTPPEAGFVVDGHQWTERQWYLFKHVYDEYPYVSDAWAKNVALSENGPSFRETVIANKDPDSKGMNKLNSPRVDDVYTALLATPPNTASVAQIPAALSKAVAALNASDAAYVRNTAGEQRELTTLLTSRLTGPALAEVHRELEKTAAKKLIV